MDCTHEILSSFQVVESVERNGGVPLPYVDVVPEIRKQITGRLTSFLQSSGTKGSILLNGFAGCGKSTLLEKIVEDLNDSRIHIFTENTSSIANGEIYIIRDYGADARTRDLGPIFEGVQSVLVVMGVNYGDEEDAKRKMSEMGLEIVNVPYGKEVASKLLDELNFSNVIKAHGFAYSCDQCNEQCACRDFYKMIFKDTDREIDGEKNVLDRLYFLYLFSFATREDITDRLTPRYIVKWMIESAAFEEKVHLIPSVDAAWSGRTTEDEFLDPDKKFNSLFVGGMAFKAFLRYIVKGLSGPNEAEFEDLFLNGIRQYVLVKFEQTSRIEREMMPDELLIGAFSDRMTTFEERKYPVFYIEKRHLGFEVDSELLEIRVAYHFDEDKVAELRLPYEIFRVIYELAKGTVVLSNEKLEEFVRKFLDECLHLYAKTKGFDNTQHLLLSAAKMSPELRELNMATGKSTKTPELQSSTQLVELHIAKSLSPKHQYETIAGYTVEFGGTPTIGGGRYGIVPRKSIQPPSARLRAFIAAAYAKLGYKVHLPNCGVDGTTEEIALQGRTDVIVPTKAEAVEARLTPEELAILIGFQRMFTIHKGTEWERYLTVGNCLSDHVWWDDLDHITRATREYYLDYLFDIGFLKKDNRFERIAPTPQFLAATVKFECSKANNAKLPFNEYKKALSNKYCVKVVDDADLKKRLSWLGMYEKAPDGAETVRPKGD